MRVCTVYLMCVLATGEGVMGRGRIVGVVRDGGRSLALGSQHCRGEGERKERDGMREREREGWNIG